MQEWEVVIRFEGRGRGQMVGVNSNNRTKQIAARLPAVGRTCQHGVVGADEPPARMM